MYGKNLHKLTKFMSQETGHTGKQYIYNSLCNYIIYHCSVGATMADCRKKAVYKILGRLGFLFTEPNQVITWISLGYEVKIHELAKFDCNDVLTGFELTGDDPEHRYSGALGKSEDEGDPMGVSGPLQVRGGLQYLHVSV